MKFKEKILVLILAILCINNNIVLADEIDDKLEEGYVNEVVEEVLSESANEPEILSRSASIFDRKSNVEIWGKNSNLKVPMASTTKIMTAIVLLENGDLNKTIEVDKKAASVGGSRLGLSTNDKITLHDLLYGLMLCSRK